MEKLKKHLRRTSAFKQSSALSVLRIALDKCTNLAESERTLVANFYHLVRSDSLNDVETRAKENTANNDGEGPISTLITAPSVLRAPNTSPDLGTTTEITIATTTDEPTSLAPLALEAPSSPSSIFELETSAPQFANILDSTLTSETNGSISEEILNDQTTSATKVFNSGPTPPSRPYDEEILFEESFFNDFEEFLYKTHAQF
ncbi:hypothetical protein HK098_001793 [Nowakowskiella sp. JEL0407]|nr:hypothetical protein HK098_001793 [Nowakowskiella sp. JEL0407]